MVPATAATRPITNRLRRADGLLSRRVLDELLVMSPKGEVVLLAGSAAQVWRALEHHDDVHGLVARLSEMFGAPAHVVADDVAGLLAELAAHGLVVAGEAPAGGP